MKAVLFALVTFGLCTRALAQLAPGDPLAGLEKLKDFEAMRASSSDPDWHNGNADSRPIAPGATLVLADGTFQLTSAYTDGLPIQAGQGTNYNTLVTTDFVTWITLSNALTWSNAMLLLNDPVASNCSSRFYRLVEH